MANVYFFTGFPGFIASSLVRQLIRDGYPADRIYLLVQPSYMAKAASVMESISADENVPSDLFTLIPGDITVPGLGLPPETNRELSGRVTHVYHLAAIYDLAVPKDIAYNVNVNGTRNVNDWVSGIAGLRRYIYFSTAYVSGTREGRILETELEQGQSFKNHYESTKHEAEMLVRGIMDRVPTTVIRPGIVKGNSKTGETIKFDGPYFILNLFDKLRFLPIIPYFGKGAAEGNFVPVDYIFNATNYLGHKDGGADKTYHLTDPRPYTMREVYGAVMKEYLRRQPLGILPLAVSKSFLSSSAVRKWLRVEKEALDYFTCKAVYDCTQAQRDLEGSGIRCPDFMETIGPMVRFYDAHKNDSDKQLRIQ